MVVYILWSARLEGRALSRATFKACGTFWIEASMAVCPRSLDSNGLIPLFLASANHIAAGALAQPRFHDQLIPNPMVLEYTYDNSTAAYLKNLGHNVTYIAPGQSKGQILRRLANGTYEAASEPRLTSSGGRVS